jgi:hypothetical protein
MADFSSPKTYNYIWNAPKFEGVTFSGSNISQFINDVGYITTSSIPSSPTSSLLETASFSDPNLIFTKGDKSTFNVNISSLTVTFASTASYIDGGTF